MLVWTWWEAENINNWISSRSNNKHSKRLINYSSHRMVWTARTTTCCSLDKHREVTILTSGTSTCKIKLWISLHISFQRCKITNMRCKNREWMGKIWWKTTWSQISTGLKASLSKTGWQRCTTNKILAWITCNNSPTSTSIRTQAAESKLASQPN